MYEPVSAVSEFVLGCLSTPLPHILADSGTGARLGDSDTSLLDLGRFTMFCIVFEDSIPALSGLVPASLVNFCWDPEIEADLAGQGGAPTVFLREDLKN